MTKPSALLTGAAALLVASALTACASGSAGTNVEASASLAVAAAGSASDLASVCPKTIAWQTGWVPQAEHGPVYQMLGGKWRDSIRIYADTTESMDPAEYGRRARNSLPGCNAGGRCATHYRRHAGPRRSEFA